MPHPPSSSVHVYCVGLGYQFTHHLLPALKKDPRVHINAVCDIDTSRAGTIGFPGGVSCYASFDDILSEARTRGDPNTLFVISTPAECHYRHARSCLDIGSHVYVDKPLTREAASAKILADIAHQRKRGLVVGCQRRFESVFVDALDAAKKNVGEIQRLHMHAHGNFADPDPFHRENEILPAGTGYHIVDVISWLAGELNGRPATPPVIGATLRRSRDNPTQLTAFEAILLYSVGDREVPVTVASSSLAPRDSVDELLIISGELGEVQYRRCRAPRDMTPGELTLVKHDAAKAVTTVTALTKPGKAAREAPLCHLVDSVSAGTLNTLQSSGADAVTTLELIDAILASGIEVRS